MQLTWDSHFFFNETSDIIEEIARHLVCRNMVGVYQTASRLEGLVTRLGRLYVDLSVVWKKVRGLLAALDDAGLLRLEKKVVENVLNLDAVFSSLGIFLEIAVCFLCLKESSYVSNVLDDDDKVSWYLGVCNLEAKTALVEYDKVSLKWIESAQRQYRSIGGGYLVRQFYSRSFGVNSDDSDGDSTSNGGMEYNSPSPVSEWSGPGE